MSGCVSVCVCELCVGGQCTILMDWSCTGEQSVSVPHSAVWSVVGLQGAHTCSGGTQGAHTCSDCTVSTPAGAPCPGSRRLHRTCTMCLLSVQVSWHLFMTNFTTLPSQCALLLYALRSVGRTAADREQTNVEHVWLEQ